MKILRYAPIDSEKSLMPCGNEVVTSFGKFPPKLCTPSSMGTAWIGANEDLVVAGRALLAALWDGELGSSKDHYRFGLPLATDDSDDRFFLTLVEPNDCGLREGVLPGSIVLPEEGLPGKCFLSKNRCLPVNRIIASTDALHWTPGSGALTKGGRVTIGLVLNEMDRVLWQWL